MLNEIRRIGTTVCVDGMPVADLRPKQGGLCLDDTLLGFDRNIVGDTIYLDGRPWADIRPEARPFEREALILWTEPWRRHLDAVSDQIWIGAPASLIHPSHFAAEGSCHAIPAAP